MAPRSTNECHSSVNEEMQSHLYDTVSEYLWKAMALAQITIHDEFLNYSNETIHDCLWSLNEMVERAHAHYKLLLNRPNMPHCTLDAKSASTKTA